MNFIEFVGFIAMILLFLSSLGTSRRRKQNPEEYEAEEGEKTRQLREFLQGANGEFLNKPTKLNLPQPPKPKVSKALNKPIQQPDKVIKQRNDHYKDAYVSPFHSTEPDAYAHSTKDAYAFVKKKKSRAFGLRQRLLSPKDVILWHEIIGPPKALKNEKPFGNFPH